MGYLDIKAKHTQVNLRKATLSRSKKILSITGVKKGVLKEMGVNMADTRKIGEHIAATAHQLGKNLQSKKQILKSFREKWNLSDANSLKLLHTIVPENTGPSAEVLKKRAKGNIAYIRQQRSSVMSSEDKGRSLRSKLLKSHISASSPAENQAGGKPGKSSVAAHNGGSIANMHQGAAGIAKVIPLMVKDGKMKVKLNKGGEGLVGGQPTGGLASIEEARKKQMDATEAEKKEHPEGLSHQDRLAA